MKTCIVKIIHKGECSFALWSSHEREEFLTLNGRIALYDTPESANAYAVSRLLEITKSSDSIYDLDSLEKWCAAEDDYLSNYLLLKYWEFFCDVAYSVSESFASSGRSFVLNDIYDKLCMAVYADSDDLRFDLDDSEYGLLKGVFAEGIRMYSLNTVKHSSQSADN